MARYIARVELHAASYANYEFLCLQMAQRGFTRTVEGANHTVYQLPTGTYFIDSDIALREVLSRAGAAANATLKSSAVLVAEWREAMWQGLTAVSAQTR
jgi:hypothetical protein